VRLKVRLIFTACIQDGPEHWSQEFKTIDTEVELPDKIMGGQASNIVGDSGLSCVGIEFLEVSHGRSNS
jgi:hypothetical protein